jgi:hypothetical protein
MMAKLETHRFIYAPRDSAVDDRIGYVPPVLDRHGRPLIFPALAHADNPRAVRVITAGNVFETDDPHEIAFYKSHPSFHRHWGN